MTSTTPTTSTLPFLSHVITTTQPNLLMNQLLYILLFSLVQESGSTMVSTMCSYLVPSCMLAMPTMANYRQVTPNRRSDPRRGPAGASEGAESTSTVPKEP